MKELRLKTGRLVILIGILVAIGCNRGKELTIITDSNEPIIEPDYSGVTVPVNIAPLNFIIKEKGRGFKIQVKSADGSETEFKTKDSIVKFPVKAWKQLLNKNRGGKIEVTVFTLNKENEVKKYAPFSVFIKNEPVDPYLCYRLLLPGYESWSGMQIVQRSTGDFNEKIIVDNKILENNCINCHSFLKNDPGKFVIHLRGSLNGTYFVNGKEVIRRSLRTGKMLANAVYPAWHPSGKFITFSSNEIIESFNMLSDKRIEIYDRSARLVNYNIGKDEISPVEQSDSSKYMDSFPCWSPDGSWLYYCRTEQIRENFDYKNIHYDLVRRPFDTISGSFGKAEVVINAHKSAKSVSLPAISPDGNWLIFVLHNYGTFPIWHKEADLYLLNLKTGNTERMNLNSDEAESWHSWSSNGKWIVFSSKRGDGLTARPYIAYFGPSGITGKPFVLPQKDPDLYNRFEKTFNKPEFITGQISVGPREFARASDKEPVTAGWSDTSALH